ncbi:MAG: penicillin acylase family protein [Ignavibacteria bacterium]|nr:penicillin acylase family protein [Ignavibacteria bacterium]
MRFLRFLIFGVCTLLIFAALNNRIGQIPPLGKFLNPFSGFWANNRYMDVLPPSVDVDELSRPVTILWDDRRVSHIFAENTEDLFFTQGYVTAMDRLWQMDFQSYAAAGRISEIVGEATLEFDRLRRRIGIPAAAKIAEREILHHPETRAAAEAYTSGVNAFIRTLRYKTLPLEYKIFDYWPEHWTVFKSALLLKSFSYTLSFRNPEAIQTRTREVLGDSLMNVLSPIYPPYMDPVVPAGTSWNFRRTNLQSTSEGRNGFPTSRLNFEHGDPPVEGSNNWAISGVRSKTGLPILASDPHLSLTLPSIWHEIQLVGPDLNVYGITSPGAAGVLFGFNQHVAWGMTNGGSDALDYYRITFRDEHRTEYKFDNSWLPVTMRIDTISVRGQKAIIDTVLLTHFGPVVFLPSDSLTDPQIPPGAALRWIAHDPSNEWLSFLRLNRARNLDEALRALEHFDSPVQNFALADDAGEIAIVHNGKLPIRLPGQGRFLSDGADPKTEWNGWIPRSHLPQVRNPKRGFVSSANQNPVDQSYPYYLGDGYATFDRGARINTLLENASGVQGEDMLRMQIDDASIYAQKIMPTILSMIPVEKLSDLERRCYEELMKWEYNYRADMIAPTLSETWMVEISDAIWLDEIDRPDGILARPRRDVTLHLILTQRSSPFYDNRSTPAAETLTDILLQSFKSACRKLEERHGAYGPRWRWGQARGTTLGHLARIPGMGRYKLETSGNFNTINAMSGSFGPSWRMVVELGSMPKALGIYPGGQSGNPGSREYDAFVDDWVEGRAYELLFLSSPDIQHSRLPFTTIMKGKP